MQETTMDSRQAGQLRRTYKEAVRRFGLVMTENLNNNIHKGHWNSSNSPWLMGCLDQKLVKLSDAIRRGADPETIRSLSADAANYLMMVSDNAMRALDDPEQQHIRWLALLDEAGIWHHLSEEGINFKDVEGKEAAYKLARENGLHLIVDDEG